jgi:hypothetical protein
MTADLATINKVQLIAGDATVQALMAYTNALMPAYIELLSLRLPLMNRKHAIGLEQMYMDAAMGEHRRLVQLMKEHNLSGNADRAALERLNSQCKSELEVFQTHANQQAALWQEQNANIFALGKTLAQLLGPIATTTPEALLAARRELDLPLDETAYRRLFAEQQQAARAILLGVEDRIKGVLSPAP